MSKGKKVVIKRIAIPEDVQEDLHDFAKGLGTTYAEAIRFLLTKMFGNENLKRAGHRMRSELDSDYEDK